jgi:16S rRNA processing protein RimM
VDSKPPSEYVTLARVVRVRGRIGEVAAEIFTDFPERLTTLAEVFLWNGRSERRTARVRRCWLQQRSGAAQQAIFHFEGVNSISEAERLRGMEVQVPLSKRVALPAGSYFITDLIGCEVWDTAQAAALGVVRDVQPLGAGQSGTPLLLVQTPGAEMLIPLAQEICTRIDVAGRCIDVVLPEGLREL